MKPLPNEELERMSKRAIIRLYKRTVDMVNDSVVHCKDCRFRDQFGYCRRWLWQKAPKMEDDEYCSGAERKEE